MPILLRKKAAELPALSPPGRGSVTPTYMIGGAAGSVATAKAPRFEYPLKVGLTLRIAGYGLIALGILNAASLLRAFVALPHLTYYSALVLIAALTSLFFSFVVGALIADALPSFEVRPGGLAVTEFVRWRVLPWECITRLHSVTLPGDRYVVFVEYAGRPRSLEHMVYALLAGLGRRNGVFYTSDIADFEDLTRLVLEARMRATPGVRAEDLLAENAAMPTVQMALDPLGTMASVAPVPERGAAAPPRTPVVQATLVRLQLALAAVPILLFWVDNLVNGGVPFLGADAGPFIIGTAGLLLIGMLELPFVALAIQAIGENLLGEGDFQTALTTYPYLQLPRMLAFLAMFALVVIKAPFFLVALIWLAAIGWTAYLTLRFTMRLYRIEQKQAYLAAGAAGLVGFFVLLAYMLLRFPGLAV